MSSGFTPGPWKVAGWVSQRGHFLIIDGSTAGRQVAVADDEDDLIDSITARANARLIAAAPDLYEALQTLVSWSIKRGPFDEPLGESEQEDEINVAVSALRKARGEA